jgi:hypothetical protein
LRCIGHVPNMCKAARDYYWGHFVRDRSNRIARPCPFAGLCLNATRPIN